MLNDYFTKSSDLKNKNILRRPLNVKENDCYSDFFQNVVISNSCFCGGKMYVGEKIPTAKTKRIVEKVKEFESAVI
jgi:hypothetical protein